MPGKAPAARPRVSGGMNSNLGNFSGEHFDESIAQQAMGQKQLSQQAADPGSMPTSGLPGQNQSPLASPAAAKPQKARPVSPKQELKWFGQDIFKGLASLFDISAALGVDPVKDDPEKQAKKQQLHSRYQKLSQDEQAYVQKKYEQEMQKKQQEEEERQKAEALRQQQEANQIAVPSSPKKGPVGPSGSKKQKASQMINQQRQGLGKMQSAN